MHEHMIDHQNKTPGNPKIEDLLNQDSERLFASLKEKFGNDPFEEMARLDIQMLLSTEPFPKNLGNTTKP
jgi:hypothetical protein